jgi:putative nucleotidyltransferase with HDIG domain
MAENAADSVGPPAAIRMSLQVMAPEADQADLSPWKNGAEVAAESEPETELLFASGTAASGAAAPRREHPTGFEFIQGLAQELSSKKLVFPTSINITMRICHSLQDPNASTDKIVHIVGSEPVLSAQLLRLGNSVAYNVGDKRVSDLRTAVVRLGYSMVQNVAISVGVQQLMKGKVHGATPPAIEGLWKRSVRVAALSFVIARKLTGLNADTAMLVGLLHDIGKFYILNRARDYPELFEDDAALWEVVDQWHTNVGESILESWEIPDEIGIAVRDHRDTMRSHRGPVDLTDVLIAADFLDGARQSGKIQSLDWDAVPTALNRLNMHVESCAALMQETKEELAQIIHAFE